jgi:hypothetical protein
MARSDARDDRELERLVATAQAELARLVRWHLDQHSPPSLLRSLDDRLRRGWRSRWLRRGLGLVLVGALLGLGSGIILRRVLPADGPAATSPKRTASGRLPEYAGPAVSPVGGQPIRLDLTYRPPDDPHLFAVRRVPGLADDGSVVPRLEAVIVPTTASPDCGEGCLDIALEVDVDAGTLALPVPTGHAVVRGLVTAGAEQLRVATTGSGDHLVHLDGPLRGAVAYRTAPSTAADISPGQWPSLTPDLRLLAEQLRQLPVDRRLVAAAAAVQERLTYDRSPRVVDLHRQARERGLAFIDSTLSIGSGDCDVLNTVLGAVLDHAGVPCRLVVGVVGRDGRAAPGLHAWIEAVDSQGRWHAVDASVERAPPGPGLVATAPALGPARPARRSSPIWPRIGTVAAALATLILVALLAARRRLRRHLAHGDGAELAQLLRGALREPEAFRHVHELDSRPLVPVLGGRPLSLHQARRLAARGQLHSSDRSEPLADRAAGHGAVVIDARQEAGRVVAELLGASDLDRWQRLLDRSTSTPWTHAVERAVGPGWGVRVAHEIGNPIAALSIAVLGVHAVVLDSDSPLVARVHELAAEHPALAALAAADAVADHLELPTHRRRRLLAELGRRALDEGRHR